DMVATDFAGGADCILAGEGKDPDGLVQSAAARYLWLRLTLKSNGMESPRIHLLKAYFPRESYLQYLPRIYQEDEPCRLFLERFLSIVETSFDDFDQKIDRMWTLFDPGATPEKHLDWLAAWLALRIEPTWSTATRRERLSGAFASYLRRGTADGLS